MRIRKVVFTLIEIMVVSVILSSARRARGCRKILAKRRQGPGERVRRAIFAPYQTGA